MSFWAQEVPANGTLPVALGLGEAVQLQTVSRATAGTDGASGMLYVQVGGSKAPLGVVAAAPVTLTLKLGEPFTLVNDAPFAVSVLGTKLAAPAAAPPATPAPATPAALATPRSTPGAAAAASAISSALDGLARPTTPAASTPSPLTPGPRAPYGGGGEYVGADTGENATAAGSSAAAARRAADEAAAVAALRARAAAMAAEAWGSSAKTEAKLRCHAEKLKEEADARFAAALSAAQKAGKFEDPEFPAEQSSLLYDVAKRQTDAEMRENEDVTEEWKSLPWQRPEAFLPKGLKARLFDGDIEPDDIEQGNLGDCYLLSSLSVMAERDIAVENLFPKGRQMPELGLYCVRLCLQGHWTEVLLDDRFVCDERGSGPMFSHGKGDELWVMLVEKAWAKAHGTFQHIIWGLPGECLTNLTGAPCKFVPRTRTDLWDLVYHATANDPAVRSRGWHVVALMPDDPERDLQAELGLVEGHAYGVLDARRIQGAKLLQLRNPWGNTEWKGAWGDADTEHWTDAAKAELGAQEAADLDKDDGRFWISVEDFREYFAGVQICRDNEGWSHTSEDVGLRGGGVAAVLTLLVEGPETVVTDIIVGQRDRRAYFKDPRYNEDAFAFIGVRLWILDAASGGVAHYGPLRNERDTWTEAELKPGKYWVVIENDWDGKPCMMSETNKKGREVIRVGVSMNHSPTAGRVELLDPTHCKTVDAAALKKLALMTACEAAPAAARSTYDAFFDGVEGAEKMSKTVYDAGDVVAWLYKNNSSNLLLTERVTFAMSNMVIDGARSTDTTVEVVLQPGQQQLVVLRQVKAGVMVHWTATPDVELEEL